MERPSFVSAVQSLRRIAPQKRPISLRRGIKAGSIFEANGSTFDAEDGRYTVSLRRIVYVKRFAREGRVGFGGSEPATG